MYCALSKGKLQHTQCDGFRTGQENLFLSRGYYYWERRERPLAEARQVPDDFGRTGWPHRTARFFIFSRRNAECKHCCVMEYAVRFHTQRRK